MSRRDFEVSDWVNSSLDDTIDSQKTIADSAEALRRGAVVYESETVPMELMPLFE